ncbi:RNA polymerase sigma factor [Actinocrispum sp. NPDC049592]|uniref:RNA polymerase sigma factor n=1 Tax=Actinocrispum sp. NPDC049592 TaxID=3154835 RepID=UPI0034167A97
MDSVSHRAPGQAEAFATWVGEHVAAMARLVARLAPELERDDIVQESLTRAWLKRHQYDGRRGTPSVWLLAITADQVRKARARSRPHLSIVDDAPAGGGTPDDSLDLRRALAQLSERQRLAVDCVYFAGLSVAETAAVMGCAEGTVKSTLADARAKLRVLLEVAE